eukprot:m51a1_g2511 hypothetical protein (374) ;mRNA; r:154537-163258
MSIKLGIVWANWITLWDVCWAHAFICLLASRDAEGARSLCAADPDAALAAALACPAPALRLEAAEMALSLGADPAARRPWRDVRALSCVVPSLTEVAAPALYCAAASGDVRLLCALLRRAPAAATGGAVAECTPRASNPRARGMSAAIPALCLAARRGDAEMARALLRAGAPAEGRCVTRVPYEGFDSSETALHIAAKYAKAAVVVALLDAGARVDALREFAGYRWADPQHKAPPLQTLERETALEGVLVGADDSTACASADVAAVLVSRGASVATALSNPKCVAALRGSAELARGVAREWTPAAHRGLPAELRASIAEFQRCVWRLGCPLGPDATRQVYTFMFRGWIEDFLEAAGLDRERSTGALVRPKTSF